MMKRFVLLALTVVLGITLSAHDKRLGKDQTFAKYVGTATDVIDAAENIDVTFAIDKDYWYHYYMVVDIDTNTDASDNTLSCILSGSFDNSNWTTISDVTWYVSDDTIIYYTDTIGLTESRSETVAAYVITDTVAAYVITDTFAEYYITSSDSMFESETVAGEDTFTVETHSIDRDVAQQVHDMDVAAQTTTITNTVTPGGVMYQYLRFRLTGDAAGSEAELQSVALKIVRVPTK